MHPVLAALALGPATVVVDPPGDGPGHWAGAPSAVLDGDTWWLAYRLRRPVGAGRGYANVVARSADGLSFTPVATVTSEDLGTASLERPALVRLPDGGWRLYLSCATPGSKHWQVVALDAARPEDLPGGARSSVLPGSATEAWKDVVVLPGEPWQMWACRHPLDGGDDAADRMSTWRFTSADGLSWVPTGEVLRPGAGWDRRGTRVSAVWSEGGRLVTLYDGRASAAENYEERTGLAVGTADGLTPVEGPVPATPGGALRYACVVPVGDGLRVYVEQARSDGAHDLRTLLVRIGSSSLGR